MNLQVIWALALAEIKICCRLVRSWVFIVVALLISTLGYVVYCFAHILNSFLESGRGVAPRYGIALLAYFFVMIYTVGVIFLAFDVRSRDVRNKISEIIDSRPATNLDVVTGRLSGMLILLFIPMFAFIVLVVLWGLIAGLFNIGFGEPIELWSVLSSMIWDILPKLAFFGALTMFLSVFLRFRLLAVVIALGVQVFLFYLNSIIPQSLNGPITLFVGGFVHASEITPTFVTGEIVLSRVSFLLFTVALLLGAAAVIPRVTPTRKLYGVFSVVALALGSVVMASGFGLANQERSRITTWLEEHQQLHSDTFPDVTHMSGTVDIAPGKSIELDLQLDFQFTNVGADSVVFSLNPGYEIISVEIQDQGVENYEFQYGILSIPFNLVSAGENTLRIRAKGVPDESFAYLDRADVLLNHRGSAMSFVSAGHENYLFRSNYVALVPGISWYPTSGSSVDQDRYDIRPQDFFTLDLEVSVPNDWIVAGPGTRVELSVQEGVTYQFITEAPLPDLALISAKFEQQIVSLSGVDLELLYMSQHRKNFELFAEYGSVIQARIQAKLDRVSEIGLEYPYSRLSLVEVPATLRVFGGGWRRDSVLAPPGIVMMRETGFPTARFDRVFKVYGEQDWSEDEVETGVMNLLTNYFEHDFRGGNPFIAFARNFTSYQTSPTGEGAIALNYIVEQMALRLLTSQTSYYNFEDTLETGIYVDAGYSYELEVAKDQDLDQRVRSSFHFRPSVWESASSTSLAALSYYDDPELALEVLFLRGINVAQSMIDVFDPEELGTMLRVLQQQYGGSNYDYADLNEIAASVGVDFENRLGDWLFSETLPGFEVSPASVERVRDPESGTILYQTTFVLYNGENSPGLVTTSYEANIKIEDYYRQREMNRSEPFLVPGGEAVRIAIHSANLPSVLWVEPYLSLNRDSIQISLPSSKKGEDIEIQQGQTLNHVTPTQWQLVDRFSVTVDDLDEGFSFIGSVNTTASTSLFDILFGDDDYIELDEGLPIVDFDVNNQWQRESSDQSFGKYRRTHTRIQRGNGSVQAQFAANLPEGGTWSLSYHIPRTWGNKGQVTTGVDGFVSNSSWVFFEPEPFPIEIHHDGIVNEVIIDPKALQSGWNEVGQYKITDPEVFVRVSGQGSGFEALADAVRWLPHSEKE